MAIKSGIELLDDVPGTGNAADKGSGVTYNIRIFLNRGDEVPINERQIEAGMPEEKVRTEDDFRFVDHETTLGKRQAIAGIEHSLMGMCEGGYRKIRVSPHLAYRDKGIPGLIPPDAVLTIEIWLRKVDAN